MLLLYLYICVSGLDLSKLVWVKERFLQKMYMFAMPDARKQTEEVCNGRRSVCASTQWLQKNMKKLFLFFIFIFIYLFIYLFVYFFEMCVSLRSSMRSFGIVEGVSLPIYLSRIYMHVYIYKCIRIYIYIYIYTMIYIYICIYIS